MDHHGFAAVLVIRGGDFHWGSSLDVGRQCGEAAGRYWDAGLPSWCPGDVALPLSPFSLVLQ